MGIALPKHKINGLTQYRDRAGLWQSRRLWQRQIGDQHDFGNCQRSRPQDAKAPRLDQTAQRRRASRDQPVAFQRQFGLVVGHQIGAA